MTVRGDAFCRLCQNIMVCVGWLFYEQFIESISKCIVNLLWLC